jgi:hypothetical protein
VTTLYKQVIACPKCGQAYPWNSHCPPLGQLEHWTDYVSYSPQVRSTVGKVDYEKNLGPFGLLVPQLRTCVRCGVVFRIAPRTPVSSEEQEAKTPAGSASLAHYLDYLTHCSQEPEQSQILLQAWARSNDRLRHRQTEELADPHRLEILSRVISRFQNETGPNRLRAAEAARESGKFELATTLLNHQFDPNVRPYADFVRDLALLGDVLVRKVGVYPDIVVFGNAKARAAEYTAELDRAKAAWKKQKEAISARSSGVGAWGCLLTLGGILSVGLLGQLALLAILIGIILFLVFLPLSHRASRQAEEWVSSHPEPKWPVFLPTFNASPPVLRATSGLPEASDQGSKVQVERAANGREANVSEQSELVETLSSEWRDPAFAEFAQKVKPLIEENLKTLEFFLLESEKSLVFRQSFVKHQIFASAFIFTFESKQRYPLLLIGQQNQLISEIKASLPLLAYSAQQLIEGFHNFEARLAELNKETPDGFKFFVDSEKGEALGSSPSIPGFLSFLVCEEAQVEDEKVFTVFNTLFNSLIERTQKERPFDRLFDEFVHRMSIRN